MTSKLKSLMKTALLLGLLSPKDGYAARIHFFDIDGTLVHDSGINSKGQLPGWWSYWVLVRMNHLNNAWPMDQFKRLEEQGALPPFFLVTRHELDELLLSHLGTREERPGNTAPMKLFSDPADEVSKNKVLRRDRTFKRMSHIYPGFYYISPSQTFRFHQDLDDSENSLLTSYLAAIERVRNKPKKYEWKGIAFPHFKRALAKSKSGEKVFLLTDRNPSKKSVQKWIKKMGKDGHISSSAEAPKLISTTSIDGRNFGSIQSFSSRKALALAEKVAELSRSPMTPHKTLSPDYNEALIGLKRDLHEVIFYENNPDYIRAAILEMKKLAVKFPNVKLVLFHAGKEDHVAHSEFNQGPTSDSLNRWLIFSSQGKGWRRPFPKELEKLEGKKSGKACDSYLSRSSHKSKGNS